MILLPTPEEILNAEINGLTPPMIMIDEAEDEYVPIISYKMRCPVAQGKWKGFRLCQNKEKRNT